jgi:hypothetical protein
MLGPIAAAGGAGCLVLILLVVLIVFVRRNRRLKREAAAAARSPDAGFGHPGHDYPRVQKLHQVGYHVSMRGGPSALFLGQDDGSNTDQAGLRETRLAGGLKARHAWDTTDSLPSATDDDGYLQTDPDGYQRPVPHAEYASIADGGPEDVYETASGPLVQRPSVTSESGRLTPAVAGGHAANPTSPAAAAIRPLPAPPVHFAGPGGSISVVDGTHSGTISSTDSAEVAAASFYSINEGPRGTTPPPAYQGLPMAEPFYAITPGTAGDTGTGPRAAPVAYNGVPITFYSVVGAAPPAYSAAPSDALAADSPARTNGVANASGSSDTLTPIPAYNGLPISFYALSPAMQPGHRVQSPPAASASASASAGGPVYTQFLTNPVAHSTYAMPSAVMGSASTTVSSAGSGGSGSVGIGHDYRSASAVLSQGSGTGHDYRSASAVLSQGHGTRTDADYASIGPVSSGSGTVAIGSDYRRAPRRPEAEYAAIPDDDYSVPVFLNDQQPGSGDTL